MASAHTSASSRRFSKAMPFFEHFAFSLVCCSSFVLSYCLASPSFLQTEMEALLSIKRAATLSQSNTNAENGYLIDWVNSTSAETNPCHWRGVTCSFDGLTVAALNISGMNLSGTLSPAVGRLSNLVSLSVACSQLSGILPSQLTYLTSLRYLNISNNAFNGTFPTNFSRLTSLEVLDASGNNFTGELPVEVGVLSKLKHLHLGANFFTGTIPPSFGNLQNVEYLNVGDNNLGGRIPVALGGLIKLQRLYLAYNNFKGVIPVEFGLLNNLVILDLQHCELGGPIPSTLSFLSKLDTLFLQNNDLRGPIPIQLGNLTALKSLDLSSNHLSGTFPSTLCNLTNLELLSFLYNFIHGSIPPCIGDSLPKLQVLKLFNNNLTGEIPQRLGMVSLQLRQIDMCCNGLTGPIPPHICAGGKLQWLLLLSNRLSGQIPANMGMCTTLTRVRLGDNKLTGTIPEGLLFFPRLDIVELNSNDLHGLALPPVISRPCMLKTLNLANNRLTGPLSPAIANMSGLQELDLSNNFIAGTIPSELGLLSDHLSSVDLSANLLTGSIPASIALCSRLSQLNLSRNYLSGSIPLSLGNMSWLASIDLSFNNLSGIAPEGGVFNTSSLRGNPGLLYCPKVHDLSCINALPSAWRADQTVTGFKVCVLVVAVAIAVCLIYICKTNCRARLMIIQIKDSLCAKLLREPSTVRSWKLEEFEKLGFTMEDVQKGLEDEIIIGQGGSGTVYKAQVPGRVLAIKRLPAAMFGIGSDTIGRESSAKDHGFSAELGVLAKVSHRHIVKLLGWCSNGHSNLLLYEYMPNGSLAQLLHKDRAACTSSVQDSWETRFRIALGAAEGLAYLHHDCSPPILHRDVKPSNILIDKKCEAKLADFGLARPLGQGKMTQTMSAMAGTCGYLAPEYCHTLRVSEKSDVYSYGVVLLEVVTGRRPTGVQYGEDLDIVNWARKMVRTEDGLLQMLDASIIASCPEAYVDQQLELPTRQAHEVGLSKSSSYSFSSSALASSCLLEKLPSSSSSSSTLSPPLSLTCSSESVEVRMLHIAMLCVAEDPHIRPSMCQVVKMLKCNSMIRKCNNNSD